MFRCRTFCTLRTQEQVRPCVCRRIWKKFPVWYNTQIEIGDGQLADCMRVRNGGQLPRSTKKVFTSNLLRCSRWQQCRGGHLVALLTGTATVPSAGINTLPAPQHSQPAGRSNKSSVASAKQPHCSTSRACV